MSQTILVTGGAGFIGSELVRQWLTHDRGPMVVLDKLTYAASRDALAPWANDPRLTFVEGDIANRPLVDQLLAEHQPWAVVNLAAESHVDRSITEPGPFIQTNVVGTWVLLEGALNYWRSLDADAASRFRFLQASTDEVYGDLPEGIIADDRTPYAPSSPYAAAKGAADHWVKAYHRTYGLPTLITCSSNNFGPYQYPEKLLPVVITRAASGQTIPIYGDGLQQRDWLHVADNCAGMTLVLERGEVGQTYHLASGTSLPNLQLVARVCDEVDQQLGLPAEKSTHRLVRHVADRPGHDRRYALDTIASRQLGWEPATTFETALAETVAWYLKHGDWVEGMLVRSGHRRLRR